MYVKCAETYCCADMKTSCWFGQSLWKSFDSPNIIKVQNFITTGITWCPPRLCAWLPRVVNMLPDSKLNPKPTISRKSNILDSYWISNFELSYPLPFVFSYFMCLYTSCQVLYCGMTGSSEMWHGTKSVTCNLEAQFLISIYTVGHFRATSYWQICKYLMLPVDILLDFSLVLRQGNTIFFFFFFVKRMQAQQRSHVLRQTELRRTYPEHLHHYVRVHHI